MTTAKQVSASLHVIKSILEAVRESGKEGITEGALYAILMAQG